MPVDRAIDRRCRYWITRTRHSATPPVIPPVFFLCALHGLVFMFGFLASLAQFALLCGFLFVVFFGLGLVCFGLPSPSFSGELAGESVEFGPVYPAPVPPALVQSFPVLVPVLAVRWRRVVLRCLGR